MPNRGYISAQHVLETLAISPFLTQTSISEKLSEKKQSTKNKQLVETLRSLKKLDCIQDYKIIKCSIGHKCINQDHTNDYFINFDLINKFEKYIENKDKSQTKKDSPKSNSQKMPFECIKCKKAITYKQNENYEILFYKYFILLPLGILIILSIPESSLSKFDKIYKKDKILNILDILEKSGKKLMVKFLIKKLSGNIQNLEELKKISKSLIDKMKLDILDLKINKSRHKRLYKLYSQIYNDTIREKVFSPKHRK